MNHTQKARRIEKVLDAWTTRRPNKSFAGMTLAEFREAIKDTLDVRQKIAETRTQLAALLVQRANADEAALPIVHRVVNGVIADGDEGNNSALFEAMGYVRKNKRATGLRRKKGRAKKAKR